MGFEDFVLKPSRRVCFQTMILRLHQKAAHGSLAHQKVLDAITWRLHPLARLWYEMACRADISFDEHFGDLYTLSCKINERFLDEKVPEDYHQHIRDIGRGQRSKKARLKTIFETCIRSQVLESRDVEHPFVPSDQQVAARSWRESNRNEAKAQPLTVSPQDWPSYLNKIMSPVRTWSSPTVPTFFNSCMAWHWLTSMQTDADSRAEGKLDEPVGEDMAADASHWSSLSRRHCVMQTADSTDFAFCMGSGDFGISVVMVKEVSPGLVKFDRSCHDDVIQAAFVFSPLVWTVWDTIPEYTEQGLCARLHEPPQSLLADALSHRCNLTHKQVHAVFEELGIELDDKDQSHWDVPQKKLLDIIIHKVFEHDATRAAEIVALYAAPAPEVSEEMESWDEEYQELLEELCVQDQSNSAELSHLKSERKRKRTRHLLKSRKERRAKAADEKEQKKTKARLNKKKKLLKSRFKKSKAPRAQPPVVETPAPPAVDAPAGEPAGAAPANAGPAQPPPPAPDIRAPRGGKGWTVIEQPNGWLRVNSELGRCDSHCRFHSKCKFDGSLKLAKLGLQISWLEAGAECKDDPGAHVLAKEVLSNEASFDRRIAARARFSESKSALNQAVVFLERSCCETVAPVEEPKSFRVQHRISALIPAPTGVV